MSNELGARRSEESWRRLQEALIAKGWRIRRLLLQLRELGPRSGALNKVWSRTMCVRGATKRPRKTSTAYGSALHINNTIKYASRKRRDSCYPAIEGMRKHEDFWTQGLLHPYWKSLFHSLPMQRPSLWRLFLKRRSWCWRQSCGPQARARPQSDYRWGPGRSCCRRPTYRPSPRYWHRRPCHQPAYSTTFFPEWEPGANALASRAQETTTSHECMFFHRRRFQHFGPPRTRKGEIELKRRRTGRDAADLLRPVSRSVFPQMVLMILEGPSGKAMRPYLNVPEILQVCVTATMRPSTVRTVSCSPLWCNVTQTWQSQCKNPFQ